MVYTCYDEWYVGEALESCGQWYFYTKKTENRINENGYWKELTDMDQPIFARNSNKLVGWKKCLVFFKGTFPLTGITTGWFMQEFHACSPNFGDQIHHKRRSKRSVSSYLSIYTFSVPN